RLEGRSVEEWAVHERGLGTLPPGALGQRVVEKVARQVDELVGRAGDLGVGGGRPSPEVVDVRLDDGTRVVGTVPLALVAGGPGPARVTFSREKPSQRVRAWLDLMVLSLARPELHWRSVVVCRKESGRVDGAAGFDYRLAPPEKSPPSPEECLELAVELYRRGMDEPLPLFPKLSHALAQRPNSNKAGIWRSPPGGFTPPGEGEAAAVELVYGRCDVHSVLKIPARSGDPGHGADDSRATRLGRVLWCTVLASTRDQATVDRDGPAADDTGSKRKRRAPASAER
ncbi:MAG: hypothetical protein JO368_05590, partial [Acidimicrobiales bacterium]|nr:hypothetical protein [Acidimicrobiales bacterium]